MKQGRTLPDLIGELARQAEVKRDYVAPAQTIRVHSNGRTNLILHKPYELTEIGHGQLADYAGVPKAFYDRLRESAEELQVPLATDRILDAEGTSNWMNVPLFDITINRLLASKGAEPRMVRTLDGKARAFLSSSFNPDLDNYDVFRVVVQALDQSGLCAEDVASAEITDRRLYVKVVSPKLEAIIEPSNLGAASGTHHMLKEPQVVRAGCVISNSETGHGSLTVQQTVMKLMCTNLWIKEEAYRQRHIGKALEPDDDGTVYRSDTRRAEAAAKLLKVRDQIADALDETRFKALVGKMQETTEIRLEGSVGKIVEVTARKFGLTSGEKDDVLQNLIQEADLSLWGLTNAVTQTAQSVPDYDRATALEAIGGRFFALPKDEIREIVTAR